MKDNLCEICKRPGYLMAYRPILNIHICSACDTYLETLMRYEGMKENDAIQYMKNKFI